jgi:cell division topological specificity factor
MGFLDRLLGRERTSREVAKDRLQLVLVHDRAGLSPEMMDRMREEILVVLSKYVEVDREGMEISLTQGRNQNKLVADIPLRRKRVSAEL